MKEKNEKKIGRNTMEIAWKGQREKQKMEM